MADIKSDFGPVSVTSNGEKTTVSNNPTFPKWPTVCREDRLILPVEQAFFALSGVCGRANACSWVDGPLNPPRRCPVASVFSAADEPVLPLSFSLGPDRGHAHSGGARNRRMAARMARTIGPVTATSANWKVMARAWRTTRAPILISFSCRLVSDQ